ncbi:MAG TPA: DALR domain-containing protein, partial [Erysipelothrix sp.]|nr:DALR domain-containing protein [Erysipelothrix sp.]
NVANAQVVLFDTIKQLNQALRTKDKDYSRLSVLLNTFEKMLDILGIEVKRMTLSDEDKALFSNWDQAKKSKDFETADSIRKALQEKGYL